MIVIITTIVQTADKEVATHTTARGDNCSPLERTHADQFMAAVQAYHQATAKKPGCESAEIQVFDPMNRLKS